MSWMGIRHKPFRFTFNTLIILSKFLYNRINARYASADPYRLATITLSTSHIWITIDIFTLQEVFAEYRSGLVLLLRLHSEMDVR